MNGLPTAILCAAFSCLSLWGQTAQENAIRKEIIFYPWLPPTPLPSLSSAEAGRPDAYNPKSLTFYYPQDSAYETLTLDENTVGSWFTYRGNPNFILLDRIPNPDETIAPVAAVTLPKDASHVAIMLFPYEDGYRLLPIALEQNDFYGGQVKIANFGNNTVIGRAGETLLELPSSAAHTYRFEEDSRGERFSFAFKDAERWHPFFDSYVGKPRKSASMLFVYPLEPGRETAYSIRRIIIPAPPSDDG